MSTLTHLVTLTEACRILKVHPNTLRIWDKKGILKSIRFGARGDRNYKLDDIEGFIQRGQKNHNPSHLNIVTLEQYTALEKLFFTSLDFMRLPPKKIYESIIEKAKELTDADFGSIFITERGKLNRIYASENTLYNGSTPRKFGRTSTALYTKKSYTCVIKSSKDTEPTLENLGIKSIVYIPMSYKGHEVGVINMLSKKGSLFSEYTYHVLEQYGSLASLVIENQENGRRVQTTWP